MASKATLGVHSAPFSEVTPSAVQFQARYATNGSMYVSGTFAKSTPYRGVGQTAAATGAPRQVIAARGDSLKGRLRRDRDFDGHGLLFRLFLFPAKGCRKVQRLDVEDFKWLADIAHFPFLLGLAVDS